MNFCPKCGFELNDMKFCPKCGFDVSSAERQHDAVAPGADTSTSGAVPEMFDLRAALVEKKPEHYIPIFDRLEQPGASSWNWCSFLFSPYWFAYRKLYAWAAFAIFVPMIVGFAVAFVMLTAGVSDGVCDAVAKAIGIGFALFFGAKGNYFYKRKIDKLVAEAPSEPSKREQYIKSNGGVSVPMMIVAFILCALIYGGTSIMSM